jgi:hypothetical protein
MGYNFTKLNNKYDSFYFRMLIDPESDKKPLVSKIAFNRLLFNKK